MAITRLRGGDDSNEVVFLYTGALERRYDLGDLLEAFQSTDLPHARLWICGSGNASGDVETAAAEDSRITFFEEFRRT